MLLSNKKPPYGAVFYYLSLKSLDHLDVDRNARRKIEVREGLDNLWRRVQNVDKSLMDAHLELLTCVLMDEC